MKGERTRQSILDRAVDVASLEGLEGLTIGRLADELKMSKSGLFAHFGSKEDLQIATIEAAAQRYISEIFTPVLQQPRGYPRLVAICDSWLSYMRRGVFPGGCFFAAASFEFDSRPGLVRDLVRRMMDDWIGALERSIRMAQEEGHLGAEVDPSQLAFELNALFFGANFDFYLRNDTNAIEKAEKAVRARLEGLRIEPKRARKMKKTA
ncbi:MAG TPA: TetR/AcrR family transcriptional regulator [Thermoanaerobaculia bacterium]|nr:TetR/AcrR family transcriptional regulator [Thermoanaerobaculia bacterium]